MLKDLCSELVIAKARAVAAKLDVERIENEILATVPTHKLEGTSSFKANGFKLSITGKLTRKLDYDAYKELELPPNLTFVDLKPTINLKRLRAIEMVDPSLIARCVIVKPAKTTVKVVEDNDES